MFSSIRNPSKGNVRKRSKSKGVGQMHHLDALERRALLTTVVSMTPSSLSIGVAVDAHISVTFGSAMNKASINSNTYELLDSSNNVIAGRVSYNAVDFTATFDSSAPLAYGQTYHTLVVSGAGGVLDSGNGTLANDVSWSFTTAPNPTSGPGGPVLLVTSTGNSFSSYYSEIMRAEGLNEFGTADIGAVTSTLLANYSVVVLSEMTLTTAQVTTLTNWVTAGGNLIAMRPDVKLATLLGLTSTGTTAGDAYLQVNTATGPGVGITGQTIQYHGTADKYTLNGATSVATLFANATSGLVNPAVTIRSVGSAGGQAAAFTYDLAKSVIYTRQGNPAWSGQARDGQADGVIRSDDLFFGASASDPQPNWVDLNKVQIPQADEQQRLLANMITQMELDVMPLPRLWYLPNGAKAEIVMTGDDHDKIYDTRTTNDAFNYYAAEGTSNGQPIRATSYMFNGSITDAQAAAFEAQGFEVELHTSVEDASGNPRNWTSITDLSGKYTSEVAAFEAAYPSLASPITNRMHAIVWSDYDSQPKVEFANGIRLDTSYYYWPGTWTGNNPGLFTGSGMPQRFATASGQLIDVFQAATQLTDENTAADWSTWVNTLLDNAQGSLGYYGVFTVNAHADTLINPPTLVPAAVIQAAKAHNVSIVTAEDVLNFTDGRDGSSFGNLAWNNAAKTLSFNMSIASGANGLQGMVPLLSAGNLAVSSITLNGVAVPFNVQMIKGVAYAFFNAAPGNFVATYAADTTAPAVTGRTPSIGGTGVLISAKPTVTFSEDVQPGTIVFTMKNSSNVAVPGTVSYDSATHTATFTPSVTLNANSQYTVSVSGAKDTLGNTLVGTTSWSFTTLANTGPFSLWNDATTPVTANTSDNGSLELGMKFRVDAPGTVSGIRFYKGNLNTGTHVASLWTEDGTLLAQVTFTNETASGWQTMNFSSPVAINANTTYIVSYHAPNGNYSSNSGYFASSGADNTYLHGLADGVDGSNGLYAVSGTSVMPTQTFGASNYWVDVIYNATPPQDTTPPSITARTPAAGATGVSASSGISATFSEAVRNDSSLSIILSNGTSSTPGTFSYNAATFTASLTPTAALALSTTYTVTVNATDVAGNVMAPATWTFTTAGANTTSSLWTSATTPATLDSGDGHAVELGLKFQSSVAGYITQIEFYKASANTGTHVGHLWSSTGTLLATVNFNNESASGWQTATLSNPVAVTANTTYIVSYYAPNGHYSVNSNYFASAGITSGSLTALSNRAAGGNGVYIYGSGNAFPNQTFGSSNYWVDVVFSTSPPVDNTPPTVVAQSPASGATGVSTSSAISATFSEAVKSDATLTMTLANGTNSVAGTLSYAAGTNTATFTPSSTLALATTYTVTLNAMDLAGNPLAPTTWNFTTGATNTSSIWTTSNTPSLIDSGDNGAVELGVKFQSNVSGYVTQIKFYKGSTNAGTHVGHLWSSTGTLLATVTFNGESASGWQTANLSSPVAITANTTYIVSYFAPNGHYSANSGYFASTGVTSGPLTALSNAAAGGNGVYLYGNGTAFPNQTFSSSNYWVDVTFTTTPPVDTTPPTIIAQSPASGATGVSTSSAISVTFSEAVKNDSSLAITLANGTSSVAGVLSYVSATNTATFTPSAALALSTTYTVTVNAKDLANLSLAPTSWTFTTGATNTSTIWSTSTVPAVTADSDSSAVELGVKFQSNVSGYITQIEFYKGSANTGTHVGHLWSSTGTLLATVNFIGESASGWQTATLSAPVAITANTTYIVSYYAPNGHYAVNANYFASGTTNGPLTALSNAAAGGNGVFRYGAGGGFPNQSFGSSNYWVDVTFTTTPPVDNSPPTIVSRSPGVNATQVVPSSPVTVTFNEAVRNDGSLSVVLTDASNAVVPAAFSYNSGTQTATLTPNAALALSATYTVTVTATDTAGNAMVPVTWSFTTASTTAFGMFATTAVPSVTSANDAHAVELGMAFTPSVNGQVTAIRFYKGLSNTGTHVGHLWDANGNLLATVTFISETASGWQTAVLTTPINLVAGQTYIVSYYAPVGGYAADDSYFASAVSSANGKLTAPAGNNGLYRYGTGGGFPNASFNSTNYWVDVLFNPA